jgi:hypothetical protein
VELQENIDEFRTEIERAQNEESLIVLSSIKRRQGMAAKAS